MIRTFQYWIILLILSCGFRSALGQHVSPVIPGDGGIPDTRWPSVSYRTFDRVTISAGIKPLREKKLPDNHKEIRIWIGGGIFAPEKLYIINKREHAVQGELFLYWRSEENDRPDGETFHDLMMYYYSGHCKDFVLKSGIGTCKVLFSEEPDWEDIFDKVTEAGIWNLPDASIYDTEPEVLEDDSVVIDIQLDGYSITVELHNGRKFRSYQYRNPQNKSWPEADKIVQIESIVGDTRSDMKPSDVTKNYKGITFGDYRSAFNVCGNDEVWGFRVAGGLEYLAKQAEIKLPEPGTYGYLIEVFGTPAPKWLAKRRESAFIRELQPERLITIKPAEQPDCK